MMDEVVGDRVNMPSMSRSNGDFENRSEMMVN